MFFDINKYSNDELKTFWKEFAKLTDHYTSNERWSEILPKDDEYSSFLALTYDNILYNGHNTMFKVDEDMATESPFTFTAVSVILAKKTIYDYGVQQVIPYYEFETYYQTTRLSSLFERTKDFSDMKEDYEKCKEKLLSTFTEEEITIWHLLTTPELSKQLNVFFDDKEFGFQFIELFTNMMAFDFVRNYFKLSNERRNLTSTLENDLCGTDVDCIYTCDNPATQETPCGYTGCRPDEDYG